MKFEVPCQNGLRKERRNQSIFNSVVKWLVPSSNLTHELALSFLTKTYSNETFKFEWYFIHIWWKKEKRDVKIRREKREKREEGRERNIRKLNDYSSWLCQIWHQMRDCQIHVSFNFFIGGVSIVICYRFNNPGGFDFIIGDALMALRDIWG